MVNTKMDLQEISHKYQWSCKIKDDEIGETYCTHGREWKYIRVLVNEMKVISLLIRPMHIWDDNLKNDLKQTAQM